MNRPLRTRLAALAAAAVFLLSGAGDLLGAHPCAHHDAVGAAHAPAPDAGAHGHGHHGAPAPAEHDAEPCSCAGTCSAGAGAALPDAPVVPAASAETAAPLPSRPDERRLPARLLPHLLPYAQAPPRSA